MKSDDTDKKMLSQMHKLLPGIRDQILRDSPATEKLTEVTQDKAFIIGCSAHGTKFRRK